MTDRPLRLRLGESARRRARQFSLDQHVEQLLQAYSDMLTKVTAAPAYPA
jgi:hypothetical protein